MPFIEALLLLLVLSRVLGEIAARFGQPVMIGEILAGILPGPSVLNYVDYSSDIKAIAQIGVLLLVFIAGMEMDLDALWDSFRGRGAWVSAAGFVIPLICGMILGFDHDDAGIFEAQKEFLQDAHIAHAMIGMLHAIPKTPLYDRLAAENRLDLDDETVYGTNVIPLRMSREELSDGYIDLMRAVYAPEAYFSRLDDLFLNGGFRFATVRAQYWRRHPWRGNRDWKPH